MIANYAAMDIRPGSMGRPLPGIEAAIVQRHKDGSDRGIHEAGVEGELALRPGWPSMFRGYLHEEERYRKVFRRRLVPHRRPGEARRDGYFWFVGRADDVIKSSGHLIGPFEVESALHGASGRRRGGRDRQARSDGRRNRSRHLFRSKPRLRAERRPCARELLGFARKRLGAAVAPKEIDFVANVPKTRSGKIMRRLLKARELGLPEGDTSTLESELEL